MAGDGTKVGSAYVEVTPKAAGNFTSVLDKEMSGGREKGSKFGEAFSGGMRGMVSAGAVAVGNILSDLARSGAGAVRDMFGEAFEGFADYQQLSGGMEKLFGEESAKTVVSNAKAAFETAGMSANEYMEKATSISASLISSVGGDTQEAARLADVAIRAMSDNYNTFGTDAESVSNAFMGLAKQNYSMLDNLSLGYAGNQQGMLDLINDSGVLGEKLTDTSQLADVGFGKMVEAIEAVQKQQGIAGTTFDEYQTTVSGSIDALGAAWQNWLSSLGDPDGNMGEATDKLLATLETAGANVLPLVERIVSSVSANLPGLVAAVGPVLVPSVVGMVSTLFPAVVSMMPGLLQAGMQLFLGLVQAAAVMLPQVVQTVIAAGPSLYLAALDFFRGLGDALGQIAPLLVDGLVYLVTHLPEIIVGGISAMVDAGAQLVFGFIEGVTGAELPAAETAGSMAAAASEAAAQNADAGEAGQALTDSMMAAMDFSSLTADAMDGVQQATASAASAADGSAIASQLASTTQGGIDVNAMSPKATEMAQNAVTAAKSVDATSIGAEFSRQAASGVDTSAMAAKMSQVAAMAGSLNASSKVSVKADLGGVSQLKGAASAVAGAYKQMDSSISASMRNAARSAASAGASIRRSMSIPNKTVRINVARGSVQLPHFSMTGNFDPKTKAVPKVSVAWYAKGGIFPPNSPQLIGVGDARVPEVVAPIDKLEDMLGVRDGIGGNEYNVYIDGARVNDDPAIQAAFLNLMDTLQRKGAMNRG